LKRMGMCDAVLHAIGHGTIALRREGPYKRGLPEGSPTCCASAAAEALRKLSKYQRSRAPKAVSCKRLFGGGAVRRHFD
jgi:hypothetical protein